MSDHQTLENMLKLLNLLSSNMRYTPDQIGERLNVSSRTAYRYLTSLKDVGFGVEKDARNAFFIPKTDKNMTNISQLVHFTEEEETLVYDIMQKLSSDAVMQRRLKAKMASVFNIKALEKTVTDNNAHSNIAKVLSAIKGKRLICLKNYHSGNSGSEEDRLVEAFDVTDNYSTIWAFDPRDGKNKVFKLARAEKVEETDQKWKYEKRHKADPVDVFRSFGKEPVPICIEFDLLVYNLLVEEYPAAKADVRKKDKDTWVLNTNVYNLNAVGRFVLGLYDHITIVNSPELQDDINNRLNKHKV
ncbi:MAG: transcriptional regulator [Paludibacteraceae bacterium]|nr:transcriptional regulator [Paludibacteraceae bacterium]